MAAAVLVPLVPPLDMDVAVSAAAAGAVAVARTTTVHPTPADARKRRRNILVSHRTNTTKTTGTTVAAVDGEPSNGSPMTESLPRFSDDEEEEDVVNVPLKKIKLDESLSVEGEAEASLEASSVSSLSSELGVAARRRRTSSSSSSKASRASSKPSSSTASASSDSTGAGTSKRPQMKYDPDIPMSKEEAAAWRREQRRKRNRESAAASRLRQRDRIAELEAELAEWKLKYAEMVQKIRRMEQSSAHAFTSVALPSSLSSAEPVSGLANGVPQASLIAENSSSSDEIDPEVFAIVDSIPADSPLSLAECARTQQVTAAQTVTPRASPTHHAQNHLFLPSHVSSSISTGISTGSNGDAHLVDHWGDTMEPSATKMTSQPA